MKKKLLALTLSLLLLLTACGGPVYSAQVLSSGGQKAPSEGVDLTGPGALAAHGFRRGTAAKHGQRRQYSSLSGLRPLRTGHDSQWCLR